MIVYDFTEYSTNPASEKSNSMNIYCFKCGTPTIKSNEELDSDSGMTEISIKKEYCEHFVLLCTSEFPNEPEYDSKNLMKDYSYDEHGYVIDYLNTSLNNDYLLIVRTTPAPSFMEAYFVYTYKE